MKRRIKQAAKKILKRVGYGKGGFNTAGVNVPCRYSVDSPLRTTNDTPKVSIEGWIIPNDTVELRALRAVYNDRTIELDFGLRRADVAKVFGENDKTLNSGFAGEVDVTHEGTLSIEADFGKGFQTLHSLPLRYSPEQLVGDVYNPKLSENYAEHLNLLANKQSYYYQEASPENYKRHADDPRLIAFYLPQFHPIAENNDVWGEGFTEWINVTSDRPRFTGHIQPILPKDTGFYDLRLPLNMEKQIAMAKKYGIYGFCMYYYWFSGKKILDTPLNNFMEHPEWDFNFSICWANENWTKRWDGRDNEVIVAQKYAEDDPLKFIQDVEHILLDPRYITEDGKPVLMVYRASELKDPARYATVWRDYFRKKHGKELHLVSVMSFEELDPRTYGFDMALDFAPQSAFFKNDYFEAKKYPYLDVSQQLIDINFSGQVSDYRTIALNKRLNNYFKFPTYKCVTPSWDNDARKKGKGFVMQNNSPVLYGEWLYTVLMDETKNSKAPTVFINAWNEWAEGAILEPTQHYGHAVLTKTAEVLAEFSKHAVNRKYFPRSGVVKSKNAQTAVVVHLYYPDKWPAIKRALEALTPGSFDVFVSLNEKDRAFADTIRHDYPEANVRIVPNRGRDILPFLMLLPDIRAAGYDKVLKLHSKKTLHRTNGQDWFKELLSNVLPDAGKVKQIIAVLDESPALVGPKGHYVSLARYMGSDEPHLKNLLQLTNDEKTAADILGSADQRGYFAGSMFWVSIKVLEPLIDLYLMPEDFESEKGQIDGTLAHAVERLISLLAEVQGDALYESDNSGLRRVDVRKDATTDYAYAE